VTLKSGLEVTQGHSK